jgi:NhaP-type Na+/H+ and K+/H+ antiporter
MTEMTKNWVARMINRHAETVVEIDKVKKHLANASNNPKISKVTFANLSLVLRDLKSLEKDYRTMLENENVTFTMAGEYYSKIGQINEKKNPDNND